MTSLLKNDEMKNINVIAIQESWFNKKTNFFYNFNFSRFHLLHKIKENIHICFYVNKHLKVNDWYVKFLSKDCCFLQLRRKKKLNIWIYNIYNFSFLSINDSSFSRFIDSLQSLLNLNNLLNLNSSINIKKLLHIKKLLNKSDKYIILKDFILHHFNWNNHE